MHWWKLEDQELQRTGPGGARDTSGSKRGAIRGRAESLESDETRRGRRELGPHPGSDPGQASRPLRWAISPVGSSVRSRPPIGSQGSCPQLRGGGRGTGESILFNPAPFSLFEGKETWVHTAGNGGQGEAFLRGSYRSTNAEPSLHHSDRSYANSRTHDKGEEHPRSMGTEERPGEMHVRPETRGA